MERRPTLVYVLVHTVEWVINQPIIDLELWSCLPCVKYWRILLLCMTAISWTNTCCDELTERWKSERDGCFINVWLGRPSGRSTRTSRMCLCMFPNACKIICCSRSIQAGHYSLEWEFFCRTCNNNIVEVLTRGTSPELRSHILGDFQKESIQILLNFFYIADRVDTPSSKKALINLLHSTSMWVSNASLPAMIKYCIGVL